MWPPQGPCFPPRETGAICGAGGSDLAFYVNKSYLLLLPESRGPHAKLRILGAGCLSHPHHQPVLGSVGVSVWGHLEKSENEFSRNHSHPEY